MTKHLTLLLIFSVGFSQQEYNSNDLLEMDNGLWTVKFSYKPISGKVYGYFGKEGNLKKVYIGNMVNGKKEGKFTSWYHDTGTKKYEMNYKDGKQDGISTTWHENGNKKYEKNYKDGIYATSAEWYENRQKKFEITFKDGEKVFSREWNEDGSVRERNDGND